MNRWRDIMNLLNREPGPAVLVTVGSVRGSVPRETGTALLVTVGATVGTIGGGQLEFQAIEKARDILANEGTQDSCILNMPLGPELAQCCGGYVEVLVSKLSETDIFVFNQLNNKTSAVLVSDWNDGECHRRAVPAEEIADILNPSLQEAVTRCLDGGNAEIVTLSESHFTLVQSIRDFEFQVYVYGAGHVGKAVVNALSPLPCSVTWIDERADEFPEAVPANVRKIVTANPASRITKFPADGYHLVMTHSHQRDLEICDALLRKNDALYVGLIGSGTKKSKFRKRLALRGFSDQQTAFITCPIGLESLTGKHPAEIAVGVSADILLRHQQNSGVVADNQTEKAYQK